MQNINRAFEAVFEEGLGFDGSSIRGFQAINESDMLLLPDPGSAFVDPCLTVPTLSLTCDIQDPVTGQRYSRDAGYVAQKAEQHLIKTDWLAYKRAREMDPVALRPHPYEFFLYYDC